MRSINFICLSLMLLCVSCHPKQETANYIVTTQVEIQEGRIDEVLDLFKSTNPELVKDQSDWVRAIFTKNEESNVVIVQAYWKDKESYRVFSESDRFRSTMKEFGHYFTGKPKVTISEVLFEM